ncbi:hypothetical protein G5V58_15950 [Nocardioides anomalus]|uniref:Uncharacterized protein n=1 Tax=Nocardioides anomalus TaxID=2712223 RepID=A0A6G6WFF3_9ACTN|nr:hypothetical protein [Nocardioides anomalus]QIG44071.1 hypothetical protein G5V58_15950 [Nocardioides anomalus]
MPSLTRSDRDVERLHLERALTPCLPAECAAWLWDEAWDGAGLSPATLAEWYRRFGADAAALAVAAGLSEATLRQHLVDGCDPDPDRLVMLAELNCYPFSPPAARGGAAPR